MRGFLKRSITKFLKEVQQDPEHHLSSESRLAIYQIFWPSLDLENNYYNKFVSARCPIPSIEHRRYGYLGIVTARHVLPIWDKSISKNIEDKTLPHKMLTIAEGILSGSESPKEVNGFFLWDFYYLTDPFAFEVNYKAWHALQAVYFALGMCLGGSPFHRALDLKSNRFVLSPYDAAEHAVIAYSVIAEDEAGTWREKYYSTACIMGEKKWDFDLNRRLEFWTWWLTEAIPAAWEAAEQIEAE